MSQILALCCILLALIAVPAFAKKEHVVTLDADNFDAAVEANEFMLVEFYAPWCGHCKKLAPEYEKAAKKLSEENSSVVLAKVDADEAKNKGLAQKFGIQGFPTLKLFRKGTSPQDWDGPRNWEGIVSELIKQSGPASVPLATRDEVDNFMATNPLCVVGAFPEKFEGEKFDIFMATAQAMRSEVPFAHISDASWIGTAHLELPNARLFKDFEEKYNNYVSFASAEEFQEFIEEKSVPQIIDLERDMKTKSKVVQAMFKGPEPKAILLYDASGEGAEELNTAFTKTVLAKKREMKYIVINTGANEQALKYFKLIDDDLPALIVHQTSDDVKFVKENVKEGEMEQFLDDYEAGNVKVRIASEPIPEKNDNPVKTIVGLTMRKEVIDSPKNVLIEFYAPWCGHCKQLSPIYDELAKHYEDDDEVVIAKMDATANDVPGGTFTVKGFPTIFFKSADGEILQYESNNRKKDDFIKFIEKHRTQVDPEVLEAEEAAAETDKAEADKAEAAKDEL